MLSAARGSLVAIQARDFNRAVSFYKDVLGLPMTFRHENYWAEFRAPGLSIGIEAAGDGTVVGGGTISLCFEVTGIENFVERLRNRGVSFLGQVKETFHGKEAYFSDSEGNPILLHQSVSEPGGSARVEKEAAAKPGARSGGRRAAKRAKGAKSAARSGVAKGAARAGGKKGAGRKPAKAAAQPARAKTSSKKSATKSKGAASPRGRASRKAKR